MIEKIQKANNKKVIWFSVGLALLFSVGLAKSARAAGASLYLAPSEGTFFVGSTFTVSIYVNTKGNEINALQVDLSFDPNILQITSQTSGKSFVAEWLTPPSYSNTGGTINFVGGIPGGIKTSSGLISTVTFRAKSPGKTEIKFQDASRVFLNDGKGTPLTTTISNGSYEIVVAPPEGPKIFSPTHPDSEIWYGNSNPVFSWEKEEGVTDFSFTLDQNPQGIPNNESKGTANTASFEGVNSGIWYFHLKAKKGNVWGKVSHFMIRIDNIPPQNLDLRIDKNYFIYFSAKDVFSGIDHYEISITDITNPEAGNVPFFVEANSPYKIIHHNPGTFKVLLRAYDKVGNFSDKEEMIKIFTSFLSISGNKILIKSYALPIWTLYFFILFFIFLILFLTLKLFFRLNFRRRLRKEVKEAEKEIEDVRKLEKKIKDMINLEEETKKEEERLSDKLWGKSKD
jgi:hypothetical protein